MPGLISGHIPSEFRGNQEKSRCSPNGPRTSVCLQVDLERRSSGIPSRTICRYPGEYLNTRWWLSQSKPEKCISDPVCAPWMHRQGSRSQGQGDRRRKPLPPCRHSNLSNEVYVIARENMILCREGYCHRMESRETAS